VREVLSPRNGIHANGASAVWAVYFYKPYCGACRRLRPTVEALGSTVTAHDLRFAAVDCVTCVRHSVLSSSSLHDIRRGSFRSQPSVTRPRSCVDSVSRHTHLFSTPRHTRLELMHCRTRGPLVTGEACVVAAHRSHRSLCTRLEVESFPRLRLYKRTRDTSVGFHREPVADYQGHLLSYELLAWFKRQQELGVVRPFPRAGHNRNTARQNPTKCPP
jgi:thiol-disulfide isomerase/thioredoxin